MDRTLPNGGLAEPAAHDGPQTAAMPDQLSVEFERLLENAAVAAEDFGIRWSAPEGMFVRTLLSAMHMLNAVTLRAERSFAASAESARAVAEAELKKVREVALAIEGVKHQSRAAIQASRAEQEAALRQIVAECMPNLTEEIRKTVVIREQSWNRDRARVNLRVSGLWVLGVFLAGFAASLCLQWTDSSIGYRCKTNLVSADSRVFCQLSGPPIAPSPQSKP